MNWPTLALRFFVMGFLIPFLYSQNPFLIDSSRSSLIPQSISNSIQIADINNDGFNDIIYSGYDQTRNGLFIDVININSQGELTQGYQTSFITYPDTIAEYLGGIGNISVTDVNLDGYMDLYVNGSAKSKLLFNSPSGSLNESSWLENLSVTYSNGNWADANMDGKPDLFLMGVNEYSDNILNELFLNKNNSLQEDPATIFPSLFTGSNTWGDYDNDGDPDLMITGQTADPNSSVSRLFQNDPIGRLTEVTTANAIRGIKAGASLFRDLDSDGDLDLIMTGWNKIEGKLITLLLENEPLGSFTPYQDQIDFAVAYGTIDAIDYNSDGFQDFLIAGADSVTNYAGKVHSLSARIYENNRDGTFRLIQEIPGARTAKFVDIDQDGIPDLVASGTIQIENDSSTFSNVYININSEPNNIPEAPNALNAFAVSTRAIFTWGAGEDDIDLISGLSYNLRIGTSSGGNQIMSSSVPYNSSNIGKRLIRDFNEIPHGTYYWAVQTVDGSGNVSEWSSEDTLFIPRLVPSIQSLPGVYYSSSGWADYDKDNIPDLALTGVTFSGTSITSLFQNSEGLLSQDLTQNIEAVFGGHLSWVDYTNDGQLDLTMTGFQINNFFGGFKTSFYKWNNGVYIADTDSEIDIDLNYDGIGDNWVNGGVNGHHWGDYDNDGDLDYVQGGFDNYYRRHLDIFYNDNGIMRLDTNQIHLIPINPAIVQWVDVDLDGNLDLVTIGADESQSLMMRVYINNSNHILSPGITWQSEIFGVTAGAIAFADYNGDGYDDFALSGLNNDGDLITFIAENNINTFIVSHILQGVYYGKPSWGDYDNDGDLDLLVTGQSNTQGDLGSNPVTLVFNQNNNLFQVDETLSIDSVGISFSQWGDYDQDGDLDLFLSGFKENQDVVSQVYDNLEGIQNPNKPPNAPYLLDDSNIKDNKVVLTWTPPVDPENSSGSYTPESGLRYQIQIGSEDENNQHSISTGHYGINEIGTFTKPEKTIKNLQEGNYSWRVRAIDYGLMYSEWSNTDYFYIDVTAPSIDTIRANYVTNDQIILVIKFKEDFNLDLNKEPTVLVTHPYNSDLGNNEITDDDSLAVVKQSFNGDEWTGVLILPEIFSGKAIQVNVYGVQDDRGNKMSPVSIFKTPESIISQYGGTAISENGEVSILLPQNAVSGDISLTITAQNVPPDTSSFLVNGGITYLISDLYDIKPFNQSLNKPGILRIGFPDSTCLITETLNQYFNVDCKNKFLCDELNGEWISIPDSGLAPFIGLIDTTIKDLLPVINLGGSHISINNNSYMQVQIDTFGTYGAFISLDTTLQSESLGLESIVCQPRIFSPNGSGELFEFTETNIIYSLEQEQDVTARIFNLSGRLKRIIKPQFAPQAGNQILNWDGKDSKGNIVPSGLYIVTLEKENAVLRTTVGVLNR